MKNFFIRIREYYDTLFPAVTDENIVRRTFIFYALLYLSLFFTGFSIGTVSVSNLALTIVLYIFFGLTAGNFITSHKHPNPAHILRQCKGYNLFICIFILYCGLIFLLGTYLFAFDINLADFKYSNVITFIFLIIFLMFPLGVLIHCLKNGTVGIYRFISKKRKNVTQGK